MRFMRDIKRGTFKDAALHDPLRREETARAEAEAATAAKAATRTTAPAEAAARAPPPAS